MYGRVHSYKSIGMSCSTLKTCARNQPKNIGISTLILYMCVLHSRIGSPEGSFRLVWVYTMRVPITCDLCVDLTIYYFYCPLRDPNDVDHTFSSSAFFCVCI